MIYTQASCRKRAANDSQPPQFEARSANDNGECNKRGQDIYCPPAPSGSLVHLAFRKLFWGAAFPVLVARPESESRR